MSGGIVGGLSEMLGKKSFSKGVKVQVGEKETTIDLYIIVEYGARIPDIAWEIQNKPFRNIPCLQWLPPGMLYFPLILQREC